MKKILLSLTLCLFPVLTWASPEAPEVISDPHEARKLIAQAVPGLSPETYGNLLRYAYDEDKEGVAPEDLQRVIEAAQWQVYQRLQERAEESQQAKVMAAAESREESSEDEI